MNTSWLILAALPPILWSFSNVIDQYICRRYFAHQNLLYMFFFLGCTNLPFTIIIPLFYPEVFNIPILSMVIIMMGSLLFMASNYPYLKALQIDDANIAVPMYQTIPVFTFILGYIFLSETLSLTQIYAGLTIITASIAIAWDFKTKSFKGKTFFLMMCSSLLFSIYTVFLRIVADDIDGITIVYWLVCGWLLLGISGVIFNKNIRHFIIHIHKNHGSKPWAVGVLQQFFDIGADAALIAALVIAPTAVHVNLINGLQPFTVIVISGVCALFWPRYYERIKFDHIFMIKIIFCTIMFYAIAVLTRAA